ncbi:Foldase protein PrsA 2 [bacterium HR30]|nr:Foldase protein PrsA 2 [bacterium HR30]
MNRVKGRMLAVMFSLLSVWGVSSLAFAEAPGKEQIAARVNGKALPAAKVYQLAEQIAKGAQTTVEATWSDALEQAITTEVLVQAATAQGLRVSEREVEEEIKEIRSYGPNHPMSEWLGKTDPAEVRRELRQSLLIEKFLDQRIKTRVTAAQVEQYYQEHAEQFERPPMVRASHILIRIQGGDRDAARRRAEEILQRVRKGEDFAQLAKQYSQDSYTAPKGGDLEFFPERPTPVAQAAFRLEVGQVSDVIESPYGFHLIKVTDRRPAGRAPLQEVAEEIRSILEDEQREEAEELLIEELRAKAKIEVLMPRVGHVQGTRP